MINLPSSEIAIFPISFSRDEGQKPDDGSKELTESFKDGRILSEENVSSIIAALTDYKCFIVSSNIDSYYKSASSKDYEYSAHFIMDGRYFSIKSKTLGTMISSGTLTDLWVSIQLNYHDAEFEYLYAYDDNLSGEGFQMKQVNFYTSNPSSSGEDYTYELKLLETHNNKLRMPISSLYQFNTSRIENINGGTV